MEKIVLVACLAAAVLLNPAYALDDGVSSNIMIALLGK
jgi:hypothetical protein